MNCNAPVERTEIEVNHSPSKHICLFLLALVIEQLPVFEHDEAVLQKG